LKINSKNNNKIFHFCILFSKIKKNDLKNSKHLKFNMINKSKFGDHLIYFWVRITEGLRAPRSTLVLLSLPIYIYITMLWCFMKHHRFGTSDSNIYFHTRYNQYEPFNLIPIWKCIRESNFIFLELIFYFSVGEISLFLDELEFLDQIIFSPSEKIVNQFQKNKILAC
jgi:hypothetical protein